MAEYTKVDGATTWTVLDDGAIVATVEATSGKYISNSTFRIINQASPVVFTPANSDPYVLRLSGVDGEYYEEGIYEFGLRALAIIGDINDENFNSENEETIDLLDIGQGASHNNIVGTITIGAVECHIGTIPVNQLIFRPSLIATANPAEEASEVQIQYLQGRL